MNLPLILLDEEDVDRLLKLLYHGQRPARVHTLICGCSAQADLRRNPKAWNGWQILPFAKCPDCLKTPPPADGEAYPSLARARFLQQLKEG